MEVLYADRVLAELLRARGAVDVPARLIAGRPADRSVWNKLLCLSR